MANRTQLNRYRWSALLVSLVALGLAFGSKFYRGPNWQFSNARLGDVFIVICLFFWLAIGWPRLSTGVKALVIAIVATVVEFLQLTGLPARLNLSEPFVFVLGTSFDARDFIAYAVGLTLAVLIDVRVIKGVRKHDASH